MKTTLILSILSFCFFVQASEDGLRWPIKKAIVPIGFDSNDNVQIAVTGVFPDACHQVGPTEVIPKLEGGVSYLELYQVAYIVPGCIKGDSQFYRIVDVGRLLRGQYILRDGVSKMEIGRLSVGKAPVTPGPDDFSYAPLTDAIVGKNGDGSRTIMLVGFYNDQCMRMQDKPVVKIYSDVVVIMPIVELRGGKSCGVGRIAFQEFYDLPSDTPQNFLLHVRSMHGLAINKIIGTP